MSSTAATEETVASNLTTFSSFMKRRYDKTRVEDLTMGDNPLLAMVPKDTDGSGDGHNIPMIYGRAQGIAGNYADSAASKSNLAGKHFVMTYGQYDGSVDIGRKVMKASRNQLGAFLDNMAAETDSLYSQMADELCTYLYGAGGGAIGQYASASGEVITLVTAQDVYNFELNMVLQASSGDGSSAAHTLRTGSSYVTAIDRTNGTVTVEDVSDIASITANDYLFRAGCFNGAEGNFIINGLQAFISSSDTPGNLYSMVRTDDPTRLAGCRIPAATVATMGIEERLDALAARMSGRYKSNKFDTVMLHPEDFQALGVGLKAQGIRELTDDSTRFGFQAIRGVIGGRPVKIYSDPHCPKGTAFVLAMKFWKLWSMGKLFAPVDEDGLYILRKAGSNDFEHRVESFPAFVTNAPLYHGRVALPT